MAATFYALLKLADLGANGGAAAAGPEPQAEEAAQQSPLTIESRSALGTAPSFHYNIQIHLPATKDAEVYNSIFKSLREHFVE